MVRASVLVLVLSVIPALTTVACATSASSGPSIGTGCSESVEDHCAQGGCDHDLTTALMHWSSLCSAQPESTATVAANCEGLVQVALPDGDSTIREYYDVRSGALVAVFQSGLAGERAQCLGGPASFAEPTCNAATMQKCVQPEAGADTASD